ncbi:MAG TPA: RNA methyltransferase [Bacteroidia bacterium]|nr:RNA methyltransferase [Bacteroidia bacterium]
MQVNSKQINYLNHQEFILYIEGLLPESKKKKIAQVLPFRTRHIVTVIENVLDSNNTNAILRTSEALGIQEAHLVYGNIKYIPQKSVSKGAHLWMDTFKYGAEQSDNALDCIKALKQKGYQLIVTSPNATKKLEELNIAQPMAICFGQESKGLSETFLSHANDQICIPQYGFTESYNVAVAAGMVLLPLIEKLRKSSIKWQLSEIEKELIYKQWLLNCTMHLEEHFKRFKKII